MVVASLAVAIVAFRGAIGKLLTRPEAAPEPAIVFPLKVETPQDAYYRYDLIPVTVRVVDAHGQPQSKTAPDLVVKRDGRDRAEHW